MSDLRRRRLLSTEERELWETVAKTAKPLRKVKRKLAPKAAHKIAQEGPAPAPPEPQRIKSAAVVAPKPKPPPPAPLTQPLGRREKSRIARGRHDIDARLDLHGMTQSEAHAELLRFLKRMQSREATIVLVITGKGRTGERERGVLRRQVPLWLALPEFRACVSGFDEAHIAHGGEGALYVRLRRARSTDQG